MVEQYLPLNISEESSWVDFQVKKQEISEVLRGLEYIHMKMEAVSNMRETTTTVILDTDFASQNDSYQVLYQNAIMVRKFLAGRYEKDFTIFYTMEPLTLLGWKKLCKNNEEIFQQRYFKPKEALVGISGSLEPKGRRENYKQDLLEQFLHGQKENPGEYIRKIYDDICAVCDYQRLYNVSRKLYINLIQEYQKGAKKVEMPDFSIRKNGQEWTDASRIRDWMINQFEELGQKNARGDEKKNSKIIASVKAYIRKNYADPELSLDEIAEFVHLNTSYLCTAFKQETGNTIKNYITDVRIEAAKNLLDAGNGKIYEIGLSVGYQSSQYFSQVFYKKVGVSPNDYRRYGG